MKRINKKYYNKEELNKFEKELLMMTLESEEELEKTSKGCKEMEKVAKKISRVTKEEELEGIYDIEEQERFIRERIRAHAATEGYEQGMEKGMEKGIEKGIERGIKQGIEENQKDIALKMLKKGIDINIISEITGLLKDEIINLKK